MSWLKRQLIKFTIKYIADYAKKGAKKMGEIKSNKRGIRTSEFWAAIAAAVLPILNQHFSWNIPTTEIIAIIGMVLGYIFERMRLKEKGAV